MSARTELYAALTTGIRHAQIRQHLIDQVIAEVREDERRTLLGDDLNPSALVLDAQAYRRLRDDIVVTMADPDCWDGDDAEDAILARYVRCLAEQRNTVRADVLRQAAAELVLYCPDHGPDDQSTCRIACLCEAADELRRMASAAGSGGPR